MKYIITLLWIVAAVTLGNATPEDPITKKDLIFWMCILISQIIGWSRL